MLVHPSGIDVSSSALRLLSARLRDHRRQPGTRWRRLSTGRQALLALAHLRCGHTHLRAARRGLRRGHYHCLPVYRRGRRCAGRARPRPGRRGQDRTEQSVSDPRWDLLPIDRIAADRPFYSGKHKKHGMNVQLIADPHGRLLWASPALPGAVHAGPASTCCGSESCRLDRSSVTQQTGPSS